MGELRPLWALVGLGTGFGCVVGACSTDEAVIQRPTTTSSTSSTSSAGGTGGTPGAGGEGAAMASGGAGGTGGSGTAGAGGEGGSLPTAQPLTPQWDRHLSGLGQAFVRAIAVNTAGEIAVAGVFTGTIDFGGGPLDSNGNDIFIVKLSSTGQYLWAKRFGDADLQGVSGIAFDASSNLVVTGSFVGNLDFGGGALDATGSQFTDVYVAKLDAAGNEIWAQRYGDINVQEAGGLSIGSNGAIYVVGSFQNTIDFGGGPLTTAGDRDAFLLELDGSGNHQRSVAYGDTANQYGLAVTALANGYAIAGVTEGTINLGGGGIGNLDGPRTFWGRYDLFGNHVASQVIAGTGENRPVGLAPALGGDLTIAGNFKTGIDLGAGPIAAQGNDDIYLARFGTGGALVDSQVFGDNGAQRALGLSALPLGPLLVGRYQSQIELGATTLNSAGSYDGFAIAPSYYRYAAFGDASYQAMTAVAVDGNGRIVVAGDYSGSIDLGSGFVTGTLDAFVVTYAPL